jgi:hypothetical protein
VFGRNLITRLTSAASSRVGISRICNVGQKLGLSLPMLTCSPSAWPFRLLYRRGRKSRRDLPITQCMCIIYRHPVFRHKFNAIQFFVNGLVNRPALCIVTRCLGAFAKLRIATISFVMSARRHGTTRLPLHGCPRSLIFEYFSKISLEYSTFIPIGRP